MNDADGRPKISSMLMRPSTSGTKGMSVDLEALILSDGLDPREYVSTPDWMGSVSLTAGEFRGEGFQVGYDPISTNVYHGEVWGNFTSGLQKRLRRLAQWYVEIPGVFLN